MKKVVSGFERFAHSDWLAVRILFAGDYLLDASTWWFFCIEKHCKYVSSKYGVKVSAPKDKG